MLVGIVVALLAGAARTMARVVNAQLAARTSPLHSTLYTYVIGLLCSLLALLLSREPFPLAALTSGQIPLWAYWGGAVGVMFVVVSNLTVPKLSAFVMTLLMVIGQVAAGIVIDAVAAQQFAPGKLVGGVLLLLGLLGKLAADAGWPRQRA